MSTTIPPATLIGHKFGNYRLERLLGRGRMGTVYLAQDEALLRRVALKLIAWGLPDAQNHDPETWLLAEARNIARVNHPAVVQVYGLARQGGTGYIAMEYVDGVSADRIVRDRGPFSATIATEILLQIAGALQAAHECGVIHRDVKPANILIRADNSAKLGDFGMAIHSKTPAAASGELQVGTPLYAAPELWNGLPATPATDLYALGATYHFMLTGHPPFETDDLACLREAHRAHEPPRLDDLSGIIPAACVDLARACLAKSPEDRVASAQELSWLARGALRACQNFRRDVRPAATQPSQPAAAERPSLRHTLGLVRSPFIDGEGELEIAQLEPFRSAAAELSVALDEPGSVVLLSSAPGAGGSRLVKELARPPRQRGRVAFLDGNRAAQEGSLAQRACRAFGAQPSTEDGQDGALEGLVQQLAQTASASKERAPSKERALLVVDAAPWPRALEPELEPLAAAARATGLFNLIVLSGSDADPVPLGARVVHLRALSQLELIEYLRVSLARARNPARPPLLVTPDAAFLTHRATRGNLARVNLIAGRMLQIAAARQARVVNSWHAWLATQTEAVPAAAPSEWPPSDVLDALNEERAAAGMSARERRVRAEPSEVTRRLAGKE